MTRRSTRVTRALAHLPDVDPGLAALALWCDTKDADGPRTITSGDAIHIGTMFQNLPLREQIGVLGHHVLHIAFRHEARQQAMQARFGAQFDPLTYNLCADAIVNECLLRAGHALPRPAVTLSELIADVISDPAEDGKDLLSIWDVDRLYLRLASAGNKKKKKQGDYQAAKAFDSDLEPDNPAADTDQKDAAWQAHLIRAAQTAGAAGRGIGTVLRQLSDIRVSRTPWEHRLRRLLAKAVTDAPRRSYRRPRSAWVAAESDALRRGGPSPVFEPATDRRSIGPRVVVGIDTSGSISPDILSLFAGEVSSITRKSTVETHVLCFDEAVYAHHILTPLTGQNVFETLTFRREGGTSFVEVLSIASRLSPSLIVILSDMLGLHGPAPAAPVVWATPLPARTPPPFGEVIELIR
ncbi:vWA domain-containing protein [Roseobacter weihaiensis]|uniref:vWA domain-containing protein n=1 Tax=Roseobacter weihaiensis TaxID=2763262 RepID=UPI001D0B6F43|nr:VWA-like domain-containing protein [Roseobacter sp. H9]